MEYFLYLGGPIKGNSYEQAIGWRNQVSEPLRQFNIICLSPMRWREHRVSELVMKDGYNEDTMMNSKGVRTRDKFDVRRSHAILFNLIGADKVSIGTCVEYGWADAFDKPIITVIEKKGNPHEHSFIMENTSYRVETLESGIDVAKRLLIP